MALAGPGIIVMVADNDAGSITTYTATGAKFGFNLIWLLVLLGPVAYVVQEMTVRLGRSQNKDMRKLYSMLLARFVGEILFGKLQSLKTSKFI